MKHAVKFTPTAQSEYERILSQAQSQCTGPGPHHAVEKLQQVNAAAKFLAVLDPVLDTPLEGYFWWINSFTHNGVQLYYQRRLQQRIVMVLHLGDITTDPASTYELFARLVLSGSFNTIMAPFGVSIPPDLTIERSSMIH